jgi:hypothetical protein
VDSVSFRVLPRLAYVPPWRRVLLVAAAVAAALVPLPAAWVERWYSSGIYPVLQTHFTPVTNLVPIALLDLAAAAILIVAGWRGVRRVRADGFLRATSTVARSSLTFAAVAYLAFLGLWGLNYRRIPLERKLDFNEARITEESAKQLAVAAVHRVNALHADTIAHTWNRASFEAAFAAAQRLVGSGRVATPGVPKRSLLGFYFRRAAIDGMTDPFFLEVILNPDVLSMERPFVLAHEWAHLAGHAHESEANFVAWVTCLLGDSLAQYSGWLAIYSHVSGRLPSADRRAVSAQLEGGPRRDLSAIAARHARASPVVRHVARDAYDAYLRANRVEGGIENYDEVVKLILGSRVGNGWVPQLRNH